MHISPTDSSQINRDYDYVKSIEIFFRCVMSQISNKITILFVFFERKWILISVLDQEFYIGQKMRV